MGKYSEDITLLDVCPFSLGIGIEETKFYKDFGLSMDKIINKGSKLPFKIIKNYKPVQDYQKSVLIQVFEGENKFVKDNYPLGNFELLNLPHKKKDDIKINIIFELDENSILTVTGIVKENNIENSIVIKNDKGGLSRNEIENAKIKYENKELCHDLAPEITVERNYKNEMNELINKINNTLESEEQFNYLIKLENTIETFIASFNTNMEVNNDIYKEKMHFYLKKLFKVYSLLLNFNLCLTEDEKEKILLKTKKYLEIYEKKGTGYCPSLVEIFINNEDEIFTELCIQILGFRSSSY